MALILLKIVAKPLQKIICVLLLLLASPAFSLTVDGLYGAKVVIEDQSSAQVLRAKKVGLAQVLVKVTGQTQSLNNNRVRAALVEPESYLQRFSFGTEEPLRSLCDPETVCVVPLRTDSVRKL